MLQCEVSESLILIIMAFLKLIYTAGFLSSITWAIDSVITGQFYCTGYDMAYRMYRSWHTDCECRLLCLNLYLYSYITKLMISLNTQKIQYSNNTQNYISRNWNTVNEHSDWHSRTLLHNIIHYMGSLQQNGNGSSWVEIIRREYMHHNTQQRHTTAKKVIF